MSILNLSLASANRWYGISGYGIIVAAIATAVFVILQFWTSSVRDVWSDKARMKLQSETALANERAGVANERAATLEKEAAEARERAAITEERLLNERRLTARERWRLERVERAALPRTLFVDWPKLVAEFKAGHFPPINLAYIERPEPRTFALALMMAMQQAGVLGKFISLPAISGDLNPRSPTSSSGAIIITADPDGNRFAEMLWQKFQIGGGSVSAAALPEAWSAIPKDTTCLVIEENNGAVSPTNGQRGEGIDQYGGPDPAPH
jgi:hypothetical protein